MPNITNIISKAKRAALTEINPALCKPNSARLIVTIDCFFRCQMCTFWSHPKWKEGKPNPTLQEIKHWIKELAAFGIKEIDIGGGEPFIRKDIDEIIKDIKDHGMKCSLTTNGWLLKERPFPPLLDSCEVSIDGATAETNDKIRGVKGAWERAINAVKIAKEHCPTLINFVIQADNYLEMVEYCNLAKKLGVFVSFIPISLNLAAQPDLDPRLCQFNIPLLKKQIDGALKTGVVLNNPKFFENFIKRLEGKASPKPQRCMAPHRVIMIWADNNVYPCGNFDMPVGKLSLGTSFKDIYKNYEKMRDEVWNGKHKYCDSCVYGDIANRKTIMSSVIPFLKREFKEEKA